MLYQRSLDIERRLQTLLQLIQTGEFSTPALAQELGVSIPTISRDLMALRERGHAIVAEQQHGAWRYVLQPANGPRAAASRTDAPMHEARAQ